MDPVGKALWFIESHFAGEITLDQIADAGGVSRFHLSRAFGTSTGHHEYLTGVEVSSFDGVPAELSRIRIPARRYAVFKHSGHISEIRSTFHAIWGKWQPESGHEIADAPDFERYTGEFDPDSGTGTVEIWVPLKA